MVKAFDELYTGLTSGTDVVVRSEAAYDADIATTGGQVRPLDESDRRRRCARSRAWQVAEGSVTGFALILDKHGDPIQPGGAPTFGTSIPPTAGCPARRLSGEGRPPVGTGRGRRRRAHRRARPGSGLGDPVDVVLQDGRQTFTLVGIIGFGETDSLLGATMAGFDLPTAQQVLRQGRAGRRGRRAGRGRASSADELRDRIAAVLPDGVEA